jgi:hypothetical protein
MVYEAIIKRDDKDTWWSVIVDDTLKLVINECTSGEADKIVSICWVFCELGLAKNKEAPSEEEHPDYVHEYHFVSTKRLKRLAAKKRLL